MKRSFLLLLCLFVFGNRASAQIMQTVNGKQYTYTGNQWKYYDPETTLFFPIDSNICIKYKSSATSAAITALEQQDTLTLINYYIGGLRRYAIPPNSDPFTKAIALLSSSIIDTLDVSAHGEMHLTSNDPEVLSPNGTLYPIFNKLNLFNAWNIATGTNTHPIVALLDNGVDFTHEDLGMGSDNYENIWTNPNIHEAWTNPNDPSTGTDAIDDDNNGIVNDFKGANFPNMYAGLGNDPRPVPYGLSLSFPNSTYIAINYHGTAMAGLIGAKINNYIPSVSGLPDHNRIAGVAGGYGPGIGLTGNATNGGCKIMCVKVNDSYLEYPDQATLSKDVDYADQMGAKIINMSFGVSYDPSFQSSLLAAKSHNILCVASAGNAGSPVVPYPASEDFVLTVGGSDLTGHKHPISNYGPKLDVAVPIGDGIVGNTAIAVPMYVPIPPAVPSTGYTYFTNGDIGTSGAAALVSGIAALMLDVNPCIKPSQVEDVLKGTAIKSGGYIYYWNYTKPGHSLEMGYGQVDAGAAVATAQQMNKPSLDLYIKDRPDDFGTVEGAGANTGKIAWESPDIWVRNQPDGKVNQYHQNPIYFPNHPVYVYVRVHNKSCTNTSLGDNLTLYWAKGSTMLNWPGTWTNFPIVTPIPAGGQIGVTPLTGNNAVPAGDESIIEFAWQPPQPSSYTNFVGLTQVHFCFLARIESTHDPMAAAQVLNTSTDVLENNNIAQVNTTVMDPAILGNYGAIYIFKDHGSGLASYNPYYALRITKPHGRANILDYAQVQIKLDSLTWQRWNDGGRLGTAVEVFSETEHLVSLTDTVSEIAGLNFSSGEEAAVALAVRFLADSASVGAGINFALRIAEYRTDSAEELIGGELYEIHKEIRSPFTADAGGDKTINKNDIVTLAATSINESAQYKWYDPAGNLVDSGQSIQVSPQVTEQYRLVVIANADGFTDWDEVNIRVRSGHINTCSPNPVSGTMNVAYSLDNVSSAYLLITQPYSNAVSSYIINPAGNGTSINMQNFASGIYNVLLICDGTIQDAVTIQKQ